MAALEGRVNMATDGSEVESESGSSYMGSDASPPASPSACPWRTFQYHDQECSRYFDCPSHLVDRALSEDGDRPMPDNDDDDNDHTQEDESDTAAPTHPEEGQQDAESPTTSTIRDVLDEPEEQALDPAQDPSPRAATPVIVVDEDQPSPTRPPLETVAGEGPLAAAGLTDDADSEDAGAPVTQRLPPAVASRELPAAPPPPPPPPHPHARQRSTDMGALLSRPVPPRPDEAEPPDFLLPRWQPDAEVTYCPICHTQFSIFVRKHHCRKCGRVVCNSCSPHRITIPYQYIVQPPGAPRTLAQRYSTSLVGGEGGYSDFSSLGGGERVRLCNPCVPDPNTTPPQNPTSPTQRSHLRSQSSLGAVIAGDASTRRYGTYFPPGPGNDAFARSRSATLQSVVASAGAGAASSSSRTTSSSNAYLSPQSRILAGTPPTYYPSPSAAAAATRYLDVAASRHRSLLDAGPSNPQARHRRSLPPPPPPQPPPPQIAEEDECPVCHRELPPRTLANHEALREAHITICISTHSRYSNGGGSGEASSGEPPRRTGMFPYLATEKDCVDSAECTICLEEFEVGVPMARLECLCRFHRACISAWFVNHPGRCPVHQHDSFGY